jgi:hypothetical protein
VLAVMTFSSVRAGRRSTLIGMRPVLALARERPARDSPLRRRAEDE